jgi:ATP-dependent Clp protease ATP-binding subunit ClpC
MMWERLTKPSQQTLEMAQKEARRFQCNYVSTEHLLLGLLHDSQNVACHILTHLQVPLDQVRQNTEQQMSLGNMPEQPIQLTENALRVLEMAANEADRIGNRYVGTEHLLLGLIGVEKGLAGRVLTSMGVELEPVRQQVLLLQDNDPGSSAADSI